MNYTTSPTPRASRSLRIMAGLTLVLICQAALAVDPPSGNENDSAATAPAAAKPTVQSSGDQPLTMDALEVTAIGQNYVNQDAIQAKRTNAAIFDSLSQDDIGKLPDVNIADAFRRIPGIAAVNDEDEGRFVLARGIHPSLNFVTLEGMAVATHDAFGGGARNVNLEVIPASAVNRLETYKTFTPNLDGGSIGAYLNLATRNPTDRPGLHTTVGASLGYFDQQSVPARAHPFSRRLQLSYSQTMGKGDRYGLLVTFENFNKSRDQVKIIQDSYNFFNSAGTSTGSPFIGNGWAAPGQFRWYVYNNDMERTGLTAKFAFNLSPTSRHYVSVYRFRQTDDEDRFGHQVISLAGISGQTATSGTYARARSEESFTHNDIRRRLDGLHYHGEFEPAPAHKIQADAAYSETRYQNSTPFIGFRTPTTALLGLTYDSSARIQTFKFTDPTADAYLNDASNYVLDNFNYRELKTEEYVFHYKLSYAFNADGQRGPWGVEAGGDWRSLDRRVNNDRWNWANAALRLSSVQRTLDYIPPARTEPFLFMDEGKFNGAFLDGSGPGFTLTQPSSFEQSAEGDFKYREHIGAAYAMGTYKTERLRVIGGIRYENVDATAHTFRRLTAPTPDQFIPIDYPAGYRNILPSITASYELTDRLWLRAGVSRSVGRPDPSDIATQERLSADGLTITRGNPDLKARSSRNYDLSLEYYFAKQEGIASIAVFEKDISNDIFDLATQETIDGTVVTITQPTNAASSKIRGVELGLIRNHVPWVRSFLPGLGFTGNVTLYDTQFNYIDSTGTAYKGSSMPLQSKWSMNASLSYQWSNRSEVRVAYDYRDRYYQTINPTQPWNSDGYDAYGQIDVNARFRISKNLHIDFSIRNLQNKHREHLRGLDLSKLHEDIDSGSSYWLGVTYRH